MRDKIDTLLQALAQQMLKLPELASADGVGQPSYYIEPSLESQEGELAAASLVLSRSPRVLLMGGAGAGKTTLLRHRASEAARSFIGSGYKGTCPLLMTVRELRERAGHNATDLLTAASTIYATRGQLSPHDLEVMFDAGAVELLVDGLDEVASDERPVIAQQLSDVFRRYPRVRGVVSSRPAALSIALPGFAVYTLAGFDHSQLRGLVARLANDDKEMGARFCDIVLANRQFSDLARSPLLVHLLWSIFRIKGTIPARPAVLYSDFTDFLLSTWERDKGIGQRSTLTLRHKREVLEHLAFGLVERSQLHFDAAAVDGILSHMALPSDARHDNIISELLSSGLLRADGPRVSFAHKSFVEYFVARAIIERPKALRSLLDAQGVDEVLVFACGLMNDVAPLIESAINRGRVLLAAKCISHGRTSNAALIGYVIREFTREVGQPFVDMLAHKAQNKEKEEKETGRRIELLHLLDSSCDERLESHERGARFEEFAVGFFGEVFKVVSQDLHTENGELDIVVEITRGDPFWIEFGGDALVECKNWTSNVPVKEVGAFLNKVAQGRVKLAFFVSVCGFTDDARRVLRNHASNVAAPLVVPIAGDAIKAALSAGVFLEEFFKDEIRNMKYLRKY